MFVRYSQTISLIKIISTEDVLILLYLEKYKKKNYRY